MIIIQHPCVAHFYSITRISIMVGEDTDHGELEIPIMWAIGNSNSSIPPVKRLANENRYSYGLEHNDPLVGVPTDRNLSNIHQNTSI